MSSKIKDFNSFSICCNIECDCGQTFTFFESTNKDSCVDDTCVCGQKYGLKIMPYKI